MTWQGLAWPGPGHGLAILRPSGAGGEASGAGPGILGTPGPKVAKTGARNGKTSYCTVSSTTVQFDEVLRSPAARPDAPTPPHHTPQIT